MKHECSDRLMRPVGTNDDRPKNSIEVRNDSGYIPYISLLCRLILGGVFAYAGVSKILDPGGLAASIRSYGLELPEWFVTLSAHGLPYLEVLAGLYLIAGLFTKTSAWTINILMLVFIAALLQGALRGLQIDCGCFGSTEGSAAGSSGGILGSMWLAFLRDLGLLGLGLWIVRAGAGRLAVDSALRQVRSDRLPDTIIEDRVQRES